MSGSDAPPADIESLAAARAEARAARDFARADELKARIEASGWKVVDEGPRYTLSPARTPDRSDDGRVVYGSAMSVPSRLADPPADAATALTLADPERSDSAVATVRALTDATGPGIRVVLVAADGSIDRSAVVEDVRLASGSLPAEVGGPAVAGDGSAAEILWMDEATSPGGSLEAGVRRASGELVIVLEAGSTPEGDLAGPIGAALRDPSIAAVGVEGLSSSDLHRFESAGPDGSAVALGPTLLAFRRADAGRLEGIDRRLSGYGGVIAWASLALREARDGVATRQVVTLDLPIRPRRADGTDADRAPVGRRDRYRISDRFGEDRALVG